MTDGNLISLKNNKIILGTKYQISFSCLGIDAIQQTVNKYMLFLQDYRIYDKHDYYNSANYVKKIPFQYYKKFNDAPKNTGLMYVTYNCRKVTRDVIIKYHQMSGCSKTLLVVPYKINEYNNIDNVEQVVAPIPNFFEQFDTYIYTPVPRQFDCSPRLVTECFLYGKKVYMNLDYIDIGLQTRYNDCVNNLESLILKEGDDILKYIEQVLK